MPVWCWVNTYTEYPTIAWLPDKMAAKPDTDDTTSVSSSITGSGSIHAASIAGKESINSLHRSTKEVNENQSDIWSTVSSLCDTDRDLEESVAGAVGPEPGAGAGNDKTRRRRISNSAVNAPARGNAEPTNDTTEIQGIFNVLDDRTDLDRELFFENFRRRLRELDLLDEDFFDLDTEVHQEHQPPLYPIGEHKHTECQICCEEKNLNLRPCCDLPVCAECLSQYVNTQISQAIVKVECLNAVCDHYVPREEILAVLEPENKEKFYRFLVDANKEPHIKTCPRCSHIASVDQELVKTFKQMKYGHKVTCEACELLWCFPCHSPWHEEVTCKDFQKGDKLLSAWAKEHHYGQANARRCPKCKVRLMAVTDRHGRQAAGVYQVLPTRQVVYTLER